MPDGDSDQVRPARQETGAGRDAYVSGHDMTVIHQYQRLLSDGRALDALSPVSGADLLAGLSANEATFNDAAFLLAVSSVDGAADALRVLLAGDEELTISLLARVNTVRVRELIAAIGSEDTWLAALPAATEAITRCEIAARAALGRRSGRLARVAAPPQDAGAIRQDYEHGSVYWSERGGAQPVTGPVARYYAELGGSEGRLALPLTPAHAAQPSVFGTAGTWQRFAGSDDYPAPVTERLGLRCGATVYWSAAYGAHMTWGGIGAFYELRHGTAGELGFPTSDEAPVGPATPRQDTLSGWWQSFEGGDVYYTDKTGAVIVPEPAATYFRDRGVARIGFPVSPQADAAPSPYGTDGRRQRFEAADDYPEVMVSRWPDAEGPGGATIYSSEHGTYTVYGDNGVVHERLGGTAGWLGFPTSEEVQARSARSEPLRSVQSFEGGCIFHAEEHGPVPVTARVQRYLADHEAFRELLGFPVRPEAPVAIGDSGEDLRVQLFEHGILTLRDGTVEAWVRPEDRLPPDRPLQAPLPEQVPGPDEPYITPLVRKLAEEHGIDLATTRGTGVNGRIRRQDVLDAARAAFDRDGPRAPNA
jgi:uncharacterized protein with LGFP repeats